MQREGHPILKSDVVFHENDSEEPNIVKFLRLVDIYGEDVFDEEIIFDEQKNLKIVFQVDCDGKSSIERYLMLVKKYDHQIFDIDVKFDKDQNAEKFIKSIVASLKNLNDARSIFKKEHWPACNLTTKYCESEHDKIPNKLAILENLINHYFYESDSSSQTRFLIPDDSHLLPLKSFAEYILYNATQEELEELNGKSEFLDFIKTNLTGEISRDSDGNLRYVDFFDPDLSPNGIPCDEPGESTQYEGEYKHDDATPVSERAAGRQSTMFYSKDYHNPEAEVDIPSPSSTSSGSPLPR